MAVDEISNVISDGNSPNISLQTGAQSLVDVSSSELLEPKFSPITTPSNIFSSLDTPLPFDSLPENSSLEPHPASPTLPFSILDMTNIQTSIDVTKNNSLNTENVISPELMTDEKFECTKLIDNLNEAVLSVDTLVSTSQTSKLDEPEISINGDSSSRNTVPTSKAVVTPSDIQVVSTNEVRELVVTGNELQLGSDYVIDELNKDETMDEEEEEGCARTDFPFYKYNENTTSSLTSVPSTRKREIIDDEFEQISSSKSEVKRRKVSKKRPDSNIGLHNPLTTEQLELNYKSNNGKSKGKEPLRSFTKQVFKTCKKNQSQIEQTTRKEFLQPVTTDECNQSDYEPGQSISIEMDHGSQPNSSKEMDPELTFNEDGTNLNLESQSDTTKRDEVIITEEDRQMEHESQFFAAGEYQNLNHGPAASEEPLEVEAESHTIASDNEHHPPVQHTKSDLMISDSQQILLNDTWLSQDTQTLQDQAVLEESDLEEYACPDEEEMSILTNMKDWTYEDKDFEVVSLGYYTDNVSNDNEVTSEIVGIYFEEVTYNDDIPSFYHHYVMPIYQNQSQEGINVSQEDPMSPHQTESWQLVVASDIEDGMLLLLLCMDTILSIEPDEIDRELLQRAIATANDNLDSWSPTHSPKIVSASDNEECLNIEGEVYLEIDTPIIVHNFNSIRTVLKNQSIQRMKYISVMTTWKLLTAPPIHQSLRHKY